MLLFVNIGIITYRFLQYLYILSFKKLSDDLIMYLYYIYDMTIDQLYCIIPCRNLVNFITSQLYWILQYIYGIPFYYWFNFIYQWIMDVTLRQYQ